MKKSFKVIALALVAMSLTVACNNNNAEEVLDSMPAPIAEIDSTPVDTVAIDSVPVVEEPVATTTAKKPAKKAPKLTADQATSKVINKEKVSAEDAVKSGNLKEGKGDVKIENAAKKPNAADAFRH